MQWLTKEKVLKEVTNKVVSKPIKLKPTWSGLRRGNGTNIREVGVVSKWVTYKVDPNLGYVGPTEKSKVTLKGRPPPRPIKSY